jgi:hypothetical protein
MQKANKVISLTMGGLGNQLFCYAAARRLSITNNAELVIDNITGFARDRQFRRRYMLDHFHIAARMATPGERFEPFGLYRRGLLKWFSSRKPLNERSYLEQEGQGFDERLLQLRIKGLCYLDGYWQSEHYFKDIEQTVREDLQIIPPTDAINMKIGAEILNRESVAIHVRWFDLLGSSTSNNIPTGYYQRAIALIEEKISSPHYFLFSDNPEAALSILTISKERVTLVSHNKGDENAYADLWLMAQCRHFITANSTFSWWGAWLSPFKDKVVVAPDTRQDGKTVWGFEGVVPDSWIKLPL